MIWATLLEVRVAQIKLAVFYILQDREEFAKRIVLDLAGDAKNPGEPIERFQILMKNLQSDDPFHTTLWRGSHQTIWAEHHNRIFDSSKEQEALNKFAGWFFNARIQYKKDILQHQLDQQRASKWSVKA